MQITWAEIEAEAGGYREGFVAIYKKYEGLDTDEVDSLGRAIKVTKSSFAQHMGIPDRTFCRWVTNVENGSSAKMANDRPGSAWRDRENQIAEAAATKAKAEAEAVAKQQLAAQAAKAETESQRRAQEAAANARRIAQEQAAKELAAAKEAAKQDKLEALNRQAKQLKEEAASQGVDLNQLSQADKAKLMAMLANDPEQARDWFAAFNEERTRKLEVEHAKQRAAAEKRRSQMVDREAREEARKASQAYEESALHFYLTKVYPVLLKFEEMLQDKPITFDTITYSRQAPSQLVPKFDRGEDIVVAGREAIFMANAENELADLNTDSD